MGIHEFNYKNEKIVYSKYIFYVTDSYCWQASFENVPDAYVGVGPTPEKARENLFKIYNELY